MLLSGRPVIGLLLVQVSKRASSVMTTIQRGDRADTNESSGRPTVRNCLTNGPRSLPPWSLSCQIVHPLLQNCYCSIQSHRSWRKAPCWQLSCPHAGLHQRRVTARYPWRTQASWPSPTEGAKGSWGRAIYPPLSAGRERWHISVSISKWEHTGKERRVFWVQVTPNLSDTGNDENLRRKGLYLLKKLLLRVHLMSIYFLL